MPPAGSSGAIPRWRFDLPGARAYTPIVPALLDAVVAFADRHDLLPPGAHVLVAVSGGPDSSVLLEVLARLRDTREFALTVAHFNHGVRGPAADADAAFVRARAAALELPCCVGRPPGPLAPDEAHLRTARYTWLAQAAAERGASHVAVGHTRDDQVETVFLRLLRGTGLRGLGGMRPARLLVPGGATQLIRPLLDLPRGDILRYAAARDIPYRTDATNADRTRTRNRLRHDVLPELRAQDPTLNRRVARLAGRLAVDEAYLEDAARQLAALGERARGAGWIEYDRRLLAAAPAALTTRVLRQAYQAVGDTVYAPDADAIDAVVRTFGTAATHGAADWPAGVRARWTADALVVARVPDRAALTPVPFAVPGATIWPATGERVSAQLVPAAAPGACAPALRANWQRTPRPLVLRGWREGDRWEPQGRGGPEPVGEALRRLGVPVDRRPAAPVLATLDRVWWVVGDRPPRDAAWETPPAEILEVRVETIV